MDRRNGWVVLAKWAVQPNSDTFAKPAPERADNLDSNSNLETVCAQEL